MIAFLELIMGLGHARTIMIFTVIQVLSTILFSFVFIFGKWGFPACGIAGAGWGMTVGNWLSVILLVSYVLTNRKYQPYFKGIFNRKKPSFLWELLRIGAPMGAMYCIEIAFFFALTLVMGAISIQLLAATQVTLQYDGIFISAIFSMAQAITVRMGHLLGANEPHAAKQAGITGVILAGVSMLVVALFYWFCPALLISVDFDIHNPNNVGIIHDIETFLAVSAIFQIFEAMRIALFGVLRAFKDTRFTLLTSILCFWCIALPLGYFFAHHCHLGGVGLWWGLVVSSVFSVLLLCWRFKSKMPQRTPRVNFS